MNIILINVSFAIIKKDTKHTQTHKYREIFNLCFFVFNSVGGGTNKWGGIFRI